MKKGLIFLLSIVSFLGINTVSAEEIYLEYETNVNQIKPYIEQYGYDTINNAIKENIKYYNENLSNDYPYYFISLSVLHTANDTELTFYLILTALKDIDSDYFGNYFDQTIDTSYLLCNTSYSDIKQISYNFQTNKIIELDSGNGYGWISLFDIDSDIHTYYAFNYYYSNFDLYYRGDLFPISGSSGLSYLNIGDTLLIPYLNDSSKHHVHKVNEKFLIEPYYLYDGNSSLNEETYTSINLNDYSYVALSLKDYNTIPENNSSVYTNISIKGQLCITPVYNYGQTERKDILTGTQIQGCTQYYNDFTSTRMYILKDDVENHAIYYLKAYDTSKENYVKVDTSRFNITYITEDKKDNPEVLINGKVYPTLPYGILTDTSTKSEEEGYVPGASCAVGDLNCYDKYSSENIFDEVFSSPLDFLKNIWSSVTSIFDVITEFISLLPPVMQSFLYLSFMVAVAFGLIKLIL